MRTLRLRIKDKHANTLNAMAGEVNMCWNFVNALSLKHTRRTGKFFSAFDLNQYTTGATKEGLMLHSQTVQAVNEEFVRRRVQFKKAKLRWRVSKGPKKSLGWVPFKASAIAYKNGQIRYGKHYFNLWDSYGLSQYTLKTGSFSQDARGRWYVNIVAEPKVKPMRQTSLFDETVGIDLGLKDFAATSDGAVIEAQRFYRELEPKLAVAQRARKKASVKAIHAKIANRRNDFHHKLSTRLVQSYGAIFVGNVNASKLVKTRMAKSVFDAGWSAFRTMLQYKGDCAGKLVLEVNEAYSSQTCSACGALPESRPKGIGGLGIREWTCSSCKSGQHRDVNAAKNILAAGHRRLAAGIPAPTAQAAASR